MNSSGRVLKLAIIGAIVGLVCVAGVIVTAVVLSSGFNSSKTPVVTTVLGLIGTTITALLALMAVVGVDRKVNGHISRLTEIATQAAAQSGDPTLASKADEAKQIEQDAAK